MAKPSARDLRIAARDGDFNAIKALFKMYRKYELARDLKRGRPLTMPQATMLGALTATVGEKDTPGEWEERMPDGSIESLFPEPNWLLQGKE
jgi:hypothetical protein